MTSPQKWDAKTILVILGFFGIGSFGTLLSQAQRVTGWMAGPTIQAAQAPALARIETVAGQVGHLVDEAEETQKSIKEIKEMLNGIPSVRASEKLRRAREAQAAKDDIWRRRLPVEPSFVKGDRNP